jgi:hydrogenase maturation protease
MPRPENVIIGYGNELRGDDGVGPRAARAVAEWAEPAVRAVAVHQLTPELAAALAEADAVLFIDASIEGGEPALIPIRPASKAEHLGHTADPSGLLALAAGVYGRCPRAALLRIPGRRFDFGTDLSTAATDHLEKALDQIRDWIHLNRAASVEA